MALFNKTGGTMDEIRCDEESYLIWKWHPSGSELGENNRENAIRFGSSLSVKTGSLAVFVHYDKATKQVYQDFIPGPYQDIIKTDNLPVIASFIGLAYEGGTPFQAEVYFINLAQIIQVRFGVPFFDIFDPRFIDFAVPVAVRGTLSFNITDYKRFIELHRLDNFDLEQFQHQVRDAICRYVKNVVTSLPTSKNIPVIRIENMIADVNKEVENDVQSRFAQDFGVTVTSVDIGAIEIDKTSEGYRELLAVTKDITTASIKVKTAADLENYAERLRIEREEGQYAIHKQTQSANMGAFQVEKQAEIGVAGAESLGQMGSGGGASVDLGGGGGFNPAGMMAGVALGGAVGQNIAGAMNNVMSGMSINQQAGATPPPLSGNIYHVAINGQSAGPFDINTLSQMFLSGQITSDTLVWKSGMSEWAQASTIAELQSILANIPPAPPNI